MVVFVYFILEVGEILRGGVLWEWLSELFEGSEKVKNQVLDCDSKFNGVVV